MEMRGYHSYKGRRCDNLIVDASYKAASCDAIVGVALGHGWDVLSVP